MPPVSPSAYLPVSGALLILSLPMLSWAQPPFDMCTHNNDNDKNVTDVAPLLDAVPVVTAASASPDEGDSPTLAHPW